MWEFVKVEDRDGGVRVLTVTRPEKLNALNAAVLLAPVVAVGLTWVAWRANRTQSRSSP